MALVRVFEIPPPTGEYCFGDGANQTFLNVDWFREPEDPATGEVRPVDRELLERFIRTKRYFDPTRSYLVLVPGYSFTINYSAP